MAMTWDNAITTLEAFLDSPERDEDCMNLHQALGAMAAILSSPEEMMEIDLADLILGEEGEGLEQWLDDEKLRSAWIACLNTLDEELVKERFALRPPYGIDEQTSSPSPALSDWCRGYLQGYIYIEAAWEQAYAELAEEGLDEIQEQCLSGLSLMTVMADWEKALAENENPQKLKEGLPLLFEAVSESVNYMHNLGMMIEEAGLVVAGVPNEPYVREGDPVGRNDPCPCGSGKKYKNCCMP